MTIHFESLSLKHKELKDFIIKDVVIRIITNYGYEIVGILRADYLKMKKEGNMVMLTIYRYNKIVFGTTFFEPNFVSINSYEKTEDKTIYLDFKYFELQK